MKYLIRRAINRDQVPLLLMMKEHAMFEGHDLELPKHQKLSALENLPISIFVVTQNKQLVGYMSVIKQFSTWDMGWYLYLDCLYLKEETRGQGIGFKLMQKLKDFAKENMIHTIQWQTPRDNFSAIDFYQKLGAINREKQRFFWPVQ